MKPFIDITGASGQSFRFRLWEAGAHVPTAGNWATVRFHGDRAEVLKLGMSENLAQVPATIGSRRKASPTFLYMRLNISRAVREAEQDDLVAGQAKRAKPKPRKR